MNKSSLIFFVGLAVIIAVPLLVPRDDTDPQEGRSGLVPYTDSKTGCQYLKAGAFFGSALTPRLSADGKPMCGIAAQIKE